MLNSVDAVIDALGGDTSVATLTGVGLSAVGNWRARGKFSRSVFVIIRDALALKDLEACPSVFGFKVIDEARA